jgi:hypothetical protein
VRALFLLGLLVAGCTDDPPPVALPPFFQAGTTVTLNVDGQPDWLVRSALAAVETWAKHGLDFEVVPGGELPVLAKEPPPGALGVYWESRQIWLSDVGADSPGFHCTMVHELGHSVGMMHVSHSGSLMSEIAGAWEDGTCLWTALDEAELQRVLVVVGVHGVGPTKTDGSNI